jgi:protein-tyrosine phosphatase
MMARIDVHSHLLPGVDDGCNDYNDSLACARMLVDAGYTHAFCTPHIWPSFPKNTIPNITKYTEALQMRLNQAGILLTVMAGGELSLRPEILKTPAEDIVTYGMNRRYCLFDLWADRLPSFFDPGVRYLQSLGLTPILAHPERMRAVQDDPKLIEHFLGLGLQIQGNLQCFSDPPDAPTRRTAERFLFEDRYHMLGSDTHNYQTLPMRMQGLSRVTELVGEKIVKKLTIENPQALITS